MTLDVRTTRKHPVPEPAPLPPAAPEPERASRPPASVPSVPKPASEKYISKPRPGVARDSASGGASASAVELGAGETLPASAPLPKPAGETYAPKPRPDVGRDSASSGASASAMDLGAGEALPASTRERMEQGSGHSFADVTVHTGPAAAARAQDHQAMAVAMGNGIAFAPGRYQPGTAAGEALIAHELAHVLQFQRTGVAGSRAELEADAEAGAGNLLAGRRVGAGMVAPVGAVLGYPESGTGAADLIEKFTTGFFLDEVGLGTRLFELAWMSPDHYAYVTSVINELGSTDQDDVSYVFCTASRDDNLEEFARTKDGKAMLTTMGVAMQGGWTSDDEKLQISRIWGTLERQKAAETGQATAEKLLEEAAKKLLVPATTGVAPTGGPAAETPGRPLDAAQLDTRLRIMADSLSRLQKKYEKDVDTSQAVTVADQTLTDLRRRLTADTVAELTPLVLAAQAGATIIERGLTNLDAIQADTAKAPDYGPQQQASLAVIVKVRNAYLQALSGLLTTTGNDALLAADRMASVLPRALTEIQLARLEHPSSVFTLIDSWRKPLAEWVGLTRTQLDAFAAEAEAIGADREGGNTIDPSRLAALRQKQEWLELSMTGMAHWDHVLSAWEYLNTHGSQTVILFSNNYGAVTALLTRCEGMKAAASSGDVTELRAKVDGFTNDGAIKTWFAALPTIAGVSMMIRSMAITLVAAMASAGVGALFRTATAGYAAGDAALVVRLGSTVEFTSRQAAVFVGSAALESLAFTSTHRGVDVLSGGTPQGSFLGELAWNMGLFSVLRLSAAGVKATMTAAELEAIAAPAQHIVSFGTLQAYGTLRFLIERGRLPTSEEFGQMSAETLILMVGIGVAMHGISGYATATKQMAKWRNLRAFEDTYGNDFAQLEIDRGTLIDEFRTILAAGKAGDATVRAPLEARATDLEMRMRTLIERIKTEGKVDLAGLRAEMSKGGFPALEASQEALAGAMGVPAEVALHFEGAENQYSYRFGTTGLIESSFRDFAGYVEKSADPVTRLRILRVTFPNEDPIVFVERPDVYPASESHQIDLGHRAFQQLLTDFAVPEGAAKQYVTWLVEQQLGTASGDTGSAVKIVRRFLNDLNKQATMEGRPLVDVLLDVASTGRLARGHAAEAAMADQLEAAGIRTDPTWLDARTDEGFKGVVGEMLALQEAQARASTAGQVVLRSVHLKGSLFVDRALSELYLADVDVIPEIDLALVSEKNSAYTLHEIRNVKGFSGGGGAADASNQNMQSLAVLRGGIGKPQQVTTREGKTLWAVVSSITATDTTTGSVIDLTGRIAEVSGGAKTETVGPKGAKSFTQQLKVNAREIELIGRILRERSNAKRLGFK